MAVDPKKLAAFANQKKAPGKPGGFPPPKKGVNPFAKKGGKGGKNGYHKPDETSSTGGGPPGFGKHDDGDPSLHEDGVDVEAIGQRVQSGNGDGRLMKLAKGITEETNPPDSITDEDTWEKAKNAVEPKWDEYDEPYAVVMHVYEQMGGGFKDGGGKGYGHGHDDDDMDDDEDEDDDGGGGA
jgi:hypothetical protein